MQEELATLSVFDLPATCASILTSSAHRVWLLNYINTTIFTQITTNCENQWKCSGTFFHIV